MLYFRYQKQDFENPVFFSCHLQELKDLVEGSMRSKNCGIFRFFRVVKGRWLRREGTAVEARVGRAARRDKRGVSVISVEVRGVISVRDIVGDVNGGLNRSSGRVRLLQETGVGNGRGSNVWRRNNGGNGR